MQTMKKLAIPLCIALAYIPTQGFASPIMGPDLNGFAVLGGTTVTNTGKTTVNGNLGVSPGSAITGFYNTVENDGPGTFMGRAYQADSEARLAHNQLGASMVRLGLMGPGTLEPANLTGLTLDPGVYTVPAATSNLTGTLTLNGLGKTDQTWIFLMPSSLITSVDSKVTLSNMGAGDSVYWDVGSSATLKTNTWFAGNIFAYASVSLDNGASILDGRALAYTGAVTLNDNRIVISSGSSGSSAPSATPLPSAWIMMASGLSLTGFLAYRRKNVPFAAPITALGIAMSS